MLRGGIEKKLRDFVAVAERCWTTYFPGWWDACNLAFTRPRAARADRRAGPSRRRAGRALPEDHTALCLRDGRRFDVTTCARWWKAAARKTLGVYGEDFYKDSLPDREPRFGDGRAYFLAAKVSQ
jgi:hypothetical protein